MFWLAGAAMAGPLDLPDPDDMGRFQCMDHPVTSTNGVELGDLVATDQAPGQPTFPDGLASSLLPYAADKDLKKASKGKDVFTMAAVASLATGGQPVVLGCAVREATAQDDFQVGCKDPLPCEMVAVLEGKPYKMDRANKVGPRLAPVESPKEALGLVALLDPNVFVPLSPEEKAAWTEEAGGYVAVDAGVKWVEIVQHEEGWIVRAPRKLQCGCDRDIVRRAWWVSNDGRSCQIEESPIPLAKAKDASCPD